MKDIDRFEAFNQETILPAHYGTVVPNAGAAFGIGGAMLSLSDDGNASSRPQSGSTMGGGGRVGGKVPPTTIAFDESSDEEYFLERQTLKEAIVQQAIEDAYSGPPMSANAHAAASMLASSAILSRRSGGGGGGGGFGLASSSSNNGAVNNSEWQRPKFVVEKRAKDSLQQFNAAMAGAHPSANDSPGSSPSRQRTPAPLGANRRLSATVTIADTAGGGGASSPTAGRGQRRAVGFASGPNGSGLGGSTKDPIGGGGGDPSSAFGGVGGAEDNAPQFFASDAVEILREVYRSACPLHQDREDAYVHCMGGLSFPISYRKFRDLVRRLVETATGGNAVAFTPSSFRANKPTPTAAVTELIQSEALLRQLVPQSSLTRANVGALRGGNGGGGGGGNGGGSAAAMGASSRTNSMSTNQPPSATPRVGGGGSSGGGGSGIGGSGHYGHAHGGGGGGGHNSYGGFGRDTLLNGKVRLNIPDEVYRTMYLFIIEKAQSLPSAPKATVAAGAAKAQTGLPAQLTPIIPYVGYLHAIAHSYLSPKQLAFTSDVYTNIRNSPHISYYLYHLRHRVLVRAQRRLSRQLRIVQKIAVMEALAAASAAGGPSAVATLLATMRGGGMGAAAAALASAIGVGANGGGGRGGGGGGSTDLGTSFSAPSGGGGGAAPSTSFSANGGASQSASSGAVGVGNASSAAPAVGLAASYANPLTAPMLTRDQRVDTRTLEALRRALANVGADASRLLTLSAGLEFGMLGDPIEEGAKARLWHQRAAEVVAYQQQQQQLTGGGGGSEAFAEHMSTLGITWAAPPQQQQEGGGSGNNGSSAATKRPPTSGAASPSAHAQLQQHVHHGGMQRVRTEEEILDEALRGIERRLELVQSSAADTFKSGSAAAQGGGGGGGQGGGGGSGGRAGEIKDQLLLSIFLPKRAKATPQQPKSAAASAASNGHHGKKKGAAGAGGKDTSGKPPTAMAAKRKGATYLSRRHNAEYDEDDPDGFTFDDEDSDFDDDSDNNANSDGSGESVGDSDGDEDGALAEARRRRRRRAQRRRAAAEAAMGAVRYEPTKFATFIVRDVIFNLRNVSTQFPHPEEDALVKAVVQSLATTALETATSLLSDEAEVRRQREEERATRARQMGAQSASIAAMMGGWDGGSNGSNGGAKRGSGSAVERVRISDEPYYPPLHPPPLSYLSLDSFRMLLFCDDKAMGALETVCPAEKSVVDGVFSRYV